MIDCRNVSLEIRGQVILNSVSLQLQCGELVAIMGANGAGKTSLLSVLCGERRPSGGVVCYGSTAISEFSRSQLALARSVMPQQSPMNFPFPAWEVVAMGRTPYAQQSRRHEWQLALKCMEMTDTANLAERIYPSLSGGEKQRVQLARVLNQLCSSKAGQRYLFLDECTSSLDPAHQHSVFQLLSQLKQQNIAVIAIVHDINLASQYSDRVVMLRQGEVIYDLPTNDAMTPDYLEQIFNLRTVNLPHPEGNWPVIAAAKQAVMTSAFME